MYLLSLPESEILPQEQSELRQETHYSLSRQYPAKASLWQPVHLINPGGNKRQSLVLIQSSNASWGRFVWWVATNHPLPLAVRGGGAYGATPVRRIIVTYRQQNGRTGATSQHVSHSGRILTVGGEFNSLIVLHTKLSRHCRTDSFSQKKETNNLLASFTSTHFANKIYFGGYEGD